MKIPRRIKEMLVLGLFSYIIVSSIIEYVNTNDSLNLIVPGVLVIAILIELASRYFGAGQRKGVKTKR